MQTEIVLQELIDSGCKFAFADSKVETTDVREIMDEIESRITDVAEILSVYKDNKYVGNLSVLDYDVEEVEDYSEDLTKYSQSLYDDFDDILSKFSDLEEEEQSLYDNSQELVDENTKKTNSIRRRR